MLPAVKLSIVIPAFNEEEAIGSVIENVRNARPSLVSQGGVEDVEILVVDDGSRDRTAEVVQTYRDVRLVQHPENRGYGAALMTGFRSAGGDVLSFLDGDGTCDAADFVPMVRMLDRADFVFGVRLSGPNGMPLVRRIGNRFYAGLTRLLSGRAVTDVATGMRLFRRSVLDRFPPMPEGMAFSPAMSCHALLQREVRVAEHPITYRERVGRSKLSVVKDGFRFLKIILESALVYLPIKIFGALGLAFLVVALLYGIGPLRHYLEHGSLREDMIYRLLAIGTLTTAGLVFGLVGLVAQKIVALVRNESRGAGPRLQAVLLPLGIALAAGGIALNVPNLIDYARAGRIFLHWVYVLVGGLLVVSGSLLFALGVLSRMIDLLQRSR